MKQIIYQKPYLEILEIEEESGICVKGSSSNENYNENNYNWS